MCGYELPPFHVFCVYFLTICCTCGFSLRHFTRCFVVCLFRDERLKGRALVWCYLFARIYCGNTTVRRTDDDAWPKVYWLVGWSKCRRLVQNNWTCNHYAKHLAHLFFFYFLLPCMRFFTLFIRIDLSRFGRFCLGWHDILSDQLHLSKMANTSRWPEIHHYFVYCYVFFFFCWHLSPRKCCP